MIRGEPRVRVVRAERDPGRGPREEWPPGCRATRRMWFDSFRGKRRFLEGEVGKQDAAQAPPQTVARISRPCLWGDLRPQQGACGRSPVRTSAQLHLSTSRASQYIFCWLTALFPSCLHTICCCWWCLKGNRPVPHFTCQRRAVPVAGLHFLSSPSQSLPSNCFSTWI